MRCYGLFHGVVMLLLASCSHNPSYTQPEVFVPEAYRGAGDWQQTAGVPPSVETWWQVFNDAQLNALQERVVLNNPTIQAAEAQVRAARAVLSSAQAAWAPVVSLAAHSTRTGDASAVTDLHQLSAQARWEIDVWGRVRSTVDAAGADLQVSEGTLGAARLSVQALLAQSYFQWRASVAQQQLLVLTVAAYERFRALIQHRVDAGVAAPLDLAQADTQLHMARTQLAEARLQSAQIEHAMATLTGQTSLALDANALMQAAVASMPAVPAAPRLIPSITLQSRYDIYAAERRVASANAQLGGARAAYFPTLTLSAEGGFRAAKIADLVSAPFRYWALGPTLAATLFDAGARSAGVQQAQAYRDQMTANYRQTVLTAFQEVEDNLVAARLLGEAAQAQQIALNAARQTREIAEHQYRAGTTALLNVVIAQTNELSAESNALSIWIRRMTAAVQLYKNLGGRVVDAVAHPQ